MIFPFKSFRSLLVREFRKPVLNKILIREVINGNGLGIIFFLLLLFVAISSGRLEAIDASDVLRLHFIVNHLLGLLYRSGTCYWKTVIGHLDNPIHYSTFFLSRQYWPASDTSLPLASDMTIQRCMWYVELSFYSTNCLGGIFLCVG